MNPMIRLLALCAVFGVGAYYSFTTIHTLKIEKANAAELAAIHQEWLERANWVNEVPEAEKYKDERNGLAKWYFDALQDHYNRFPTADRNYYREEEELSGKATAAGGKKKKAKAEDVELKKQYYDLVKATFNSLKDRSYSPVYTANSNSLRLDLVKIAKRGDGQKGFRIDLVLWGAQRQMQHDRQASGETISKMNTAAGFSGMNIKLFDEKGKVAAEMPVSGDPEIKVDYPERWIEEFPPQAVIGYYNLPPVPSNAVKMELTMNVSSRSPNGADISGNFKWDINVDPEWKLAPGETWEGATTEERSKDYIDGKAEN